MNQYNLYPRLVVSVGSEFLEPTDLELLKELSHRQPLPQSPQQCLEPRLEALESILSPVVYGLGTVGYLLDQTGADYSLEVQSEILSRWQSLGASEVLLGVIKSAQHSFVPRIIFEAMGMYPQKGEPASIGDIGKKKLSQKKVRRLLESLKTAHEHYWPLDMLANIVEPYAKKTRGE